VRTSGFSFEAFRDSSDGHDFTRDQVARLSRYMTAHLKRFGQHVLDMDGQSPPPELKSLDLVDEESPLR
jgi:hypothetical protein